VTVIHYSPPKSEVHGHPIGRLAATDAVDRCLRFLDGHCVARDPGLSELMLGWNDARGAAVAGVVADVDRALGPAAKVNRIPYGSGQTFHQHWWPYSVEKLPDVARWFDGLAGVLETGVVVAHASTVWTFTWRGDEAARGDGPPPVPLVSPGGMLALHLGFRPHRLSTVFTFHDVDQYARVKAVLSQLGLVELSDRNLRPKTGGGGKKRRSAR
jgi:hypothetical protein